MTLKTQKTWIEHGMTGRSIRQVEAAASISRSRLHRLIKGELEMTLSEAYRLAVAFNFRFPFEELSAHNADVMAEDRRTMKSLPTKE